MVRNAQRVIVVQIYSDHIPVPLNGFSIVVHFEGSEGLPGAFCESLEATLRSKLVPS